MLDRGAAVLPSGDYTAWLDAGSEPAKISLKLSQGNRKGIPFSCIAAVREIGNRIEHRGGRGVRRHTPGAKAPIFLGRLRDPRLKPWGTEMRSVPSSNLSLLVSCIAAVREMGIESSIAAAVE